MDYHPDQHQTKKALLAVPAVVCAMYVIVCDNSYVSTSASDAFGHTSCKSVVHTATKLGIAVLLQRCKYCMKRCNTKHFYQQFALRLCFASRVSQ
jgi:hypothetical protein